MPSYKIRGIDVDFPFEAYDCQLVYMEKVIQSLQNRCNALLESPTGTGKTLCLLCATLAWRKSLGSFSTGKIERNGRIVGSKSSALQSLPSKHNDLPTIVYTSRTHSQLRQVIRELKRSSYRPKMIILGSREQLCIHEQVSLLRGKAQTNACQHIYRKRKKNRCTHYSGVVDYVKDNPHIGDEPVDIEDLVNIGRTFGPCPYYISRELHKVVDILFAPYNYLINRDNRKSLSIDWDNSILIFDEAHNLESLCADAASFDLPSGLLTSCISEAQSCIDLSVARRGEPNDKLPNPDNFAILRALLLKLEKRIAEVPIESKEMGFTKPGPYIYELLADLNITQDTATKIIDIIEEAVFLLEEDKQQEEQQDKEKSTGCRLESICDILKVIFREKNNSHANFYRVHVQESVANAADVLKGRPSRTLSWWCFNPGIAMQEFSQMGIRTIILTSGTLSPMASFAQELKLDFPIRLENPHVISSNQIYAGVVPVGPSSRPLNSSYRTRDSLEYRQELGNAIVNFARIVPDGLLVFFPSYYLLDQCISCWKNMSQANSTTIWERICKHKQPVIEPRQSSQFLLAIEDYMAKLKDTSTSGAVFFAVCRGKVSEGLDFADHAGRAVVITGMPFAMRTDPKVRLKREFLDELAQSQRDGCKVLRGEDWYCQQASRAVNQAIGRVIRHRNDYGAIIFCDERFAHPNHQSQISLWIQPHIKCHRKFGDVIFTLSRFFRDGASCDAAKLRSTQSEDMGNTKEEGTKQPLDKFYLDSCLSLRTPVGKDCTVKSLSSLFEAKRRKDSSQSKDILANRGSLNPLKENQDFKLTYPSSVICNEKKLLIPERENIHRQDDEMVELSNKSSLDEILSRKEYLMPCSAKKQKVSHTAHSTGQIGNNREHTSAVEKPQSTDSFSLSRLMKSEKPEFYHDRGRPDAQVSPKLVKEHATAHKGEEILTLRNKGVQSTSMLHGDEEVRGSTFLTQVKEKLTASEYKEFVEFMKALKSKELKIDHVLQSIVKLFSGSDRLHLLKRFKDFVPAKYQSLYQHYLERNNHALDN